MASNVVKFNEIFALFHEMFQSKWGLEILLKIQKILIFHIFHRASTVIQLSDVHSSLIYLAVLFLRNYYPIYSLTL